MDLEMETIRKVMLEQEAVFRQQVQELHRVYEVQKRLMQEGKTLDLSSTEVKNTVKTEGNIATTTTATRRRTFDLERPAEEYMDVEMEEPINSKASKVLDLGLGKNLNSSSFTQAATGSINRNRDGETEILQMIKRARSSEEPFSSSSSYASGFLGGLWGLGLEQKNGVRVPNGFHVDEKGTKENHVFLEGKLMDSMNPFYTGERDEHASKYASFNKNHVSYSSQGILIPSSSGNNSRSSSSFLEPGLGLWWKSSNPSFYHQGQYQQVAVLQTPGAAQAAWQTSAFNSGSSPYHLQAMLSGRTPSTGENGTSWLKNGNGACANGFQFSSSTPPKPPPGKDFKGFPKLILDNATMELKLAPAENRPCIGFLRTAQNSSESEPEQCRKVELGIVDTGEEQKGTEIPPQDTVKQELLEGGKLEVSGAGKLGLADLNAPGCVEKGEAGALEALEPKCTEEEAQEGLNESEVVQDGLLQSCRRREEDAPSSLAAKHSPEEEQEQTQQQQRSSSGKKSEQESAEPSSASSTRKRRFKLVSSKDFSTARDSKKTEETEIEPEVEKKRRKSLSHSKPGKSFKPANSGEQSPRRNSDLHDDGANLAAEILVSLAPGPKLRQPEKNGVVRNHHKSKRRLIDTLSTDTPKTSSKRTPEPPSGKDTKKKKKKKSGKTEEGHHHHQHKVSIKSVKLAVTRSEVSEDAPKSSSKQKKNSKQPNQNHTLRSSPRPTREGPRQHSTVKGSTTTTLNVVISKTSGGTAVNKNHHRNDKKNNNTHSEHESLDRFSHSAVENSSEDNLGKDEEDVQDSIWARSWGPVVRKKRMTRVKRSGL